MCITDIELNYLITCWVKPLDIYKKASRQFPSLLMVTRTNILSQNMIIHKP